MYELTVVGPEAHQRLKKTLVEGEAFRLGRAPKEGWAVPWDKMISREQADVRLSGGRLTIRCLENAQNRILARGQTFAEVEVAPGETFRIGDTNFGLVSFSIGDSGQAPMLEKAYSAEEMAAFRFGNSEKQLEILSQLPDLMAKSTGENNLAQLLLKLVVEAIPHADAVAISHFGEWTTADVLKPDSMYWDSRSNQAEFTPSRRLIFSALDKMQSVLHMWTGGAEDSNYTHVAGLDWAFCVPVRANAGRGWCIYVTGEGAVAAKPEDLQGDLRFTEVVAQFLGSISDVQALERQQASFSQFFSPKVIQTLRTHDPESLLAPRQGSITVLFCDVRGFSRKAEEFRDDLIGLLERVSEALGVMTHGIVSNDGVISGFQGDAALGFWGWPTEQEDSPLRAARAALQIYNEFLDARRSQDSRLGDFVIGIGIANGTAVAGRMGTKEQINVSTFGPVVNVGSRLEGMTKQFGVSILINDAVAGYVRKHIRPEEGRCRYVGRIQPKGMDDNLGVYELLPPAKDSPIGDDHIRDCEAAMSDIQAGRWDAARKWLEANAEKDGVARFMLGHLAKYDFTPPAGWDGVIVMAEK